MEETVGNYTALVCAQVKDAVAVFCVQGGVCAREGPTAHGSFQSVRTDALSVIVKIVENEKKRRQGGFQRTERNHAGELAGHAIHSRTVRGEFACKSATVRRFAITGERLIDARARQEAGEQVCGEKWAEAPFSFQANALPCVLLNPQHAPAAFAVARGFHAVSTSPLSRTTREE